MILNMSLSHVFGFIRASIYLAVGIFILIVDDFFSLIELQKIGLGIILITYGLVRFYGAFKKKREDESDYEE